MAGDPAAAAAADVGAAADVVVVALAADVVVAAAPDVVVAVDVFTNRFASPRFWRVERVITPGEGGGMSFGMAFLLILRGGIVLIRLS